MFRNLVNVVLQNTDWAAISFGKTLSTKEATIQVLVYHFDRNARMNVSMGLYCELCNGS
jgi:hypothetical protein